MSPRTRLSTADSTGNTVISSQTSDRGTSMNLSLVTILKQRLRFNCSLSTTMANCQHNQTGSYPNQLTCLRCLNRAGRQSFRVENRIFHEVFALHIFFHRSNEHIRSYRVEKRTSHPLRRLIDYSARSIRNAPSVSKRNSKVSVDDTDAKSGDWGLWLHITSLPL